MTLTSKRTTLLLVLGGAVVVLVSATQTWVYGPARDALLGQTVVRGTGAAVASTAVAGALVASAACLAMATARRGVRVLAGVLALLAALLVVAGIARVVADPSGPLGTLAAQAAGRTGTVATDAVTTPWLYVALLGSLLLALGAVVGLIGSPRWGGLSGRYDAPGPVPARGARPARQTSDWDRLSVGDDPTEASERARPDAH